MTIASMTGFARASGAHGKIAWVWELKSVNGKGFEFRSRLPQGYEALELELRRRLSAKISRGSLTIGLQIQRMGGDAGIAINEDALRALFDVVARFGDEPGVAPARLDGLLAVPGVVQSLDALATEEERTERMDALLASFEQAVTALVTARREEGAALLTVLRRQVDGIAALTDQAATCAGAQPEILRERFALRVKDYLDQAQGLAPDRVAQEVALMASKADVREELGRLRSHVAAARALLAAAEPVGRKFDFLAQEFNREANTLCSKSQDIELTRIGLELKNVIGQMREQIQNIE